eukprot:gene4993-16499_t
MPTQHPVTAAELRDECAAQPCGADQTCSDPDASVANDFVCACLTPPLGGSRASFAVGTLARCEVDECTAMREPCGKLQTCTDRNRTALSSSQSHQTEGFRDFECR